MVLLFVAGELAYLLKKIYCNILDEKIQLFLEEYQAQVAFFFTDSMVLNQRE